MPDAPPQSESKRADLTNQPDDVLAQVARDLVTGRIFTSFDCRPDDMAMVFMPIALGAFANATEEQIRDIGLIYEHYDKAGPRSCNGQPMFFSFRLLNVHDAAIVFDKAKRIDAAMKQAGAA